ncbi:hypothetical protein [Streptomyces roseolilacinus]|uniref:hypothetical protein n=1 Tax=Streptomyces roseolilacinus TaxID=66904 RepID=UPI0038000B22
MSGYGRDETEWDRLVDAGRKFLDERAALGTLTSYTELNTVLARRTGLRGFDFAHPEERAALGHLLGLIVLDDQRRRPCAGEGDPLMLSAVVRYLNANDAGPGFYKLAQELGFLRRGASPDEKLAFWSRQVTLVYQRARG